MNISLFLESYIPTKAGTLPLSSPQIQIQDLLPDLYAKNVCDDPWSIQRYAACRILKDSGIPCYIWAEDALSYYGVRTGLFDICIVVDDVKQAADVLIKREEGTSYLVEPQVVRATVDPLNCVVALTASSDWNITLPDVSSHAYCHPQRDDRWPFIPPLHDLLDSLIQRWLDARDEPSAFRMHLASFLGYLYDYVPILQLPEFSQYLRVEQDSTISMSSRASAIQGNLSGSINENATKYRLVRKIRGRKANVWLEVDNFNNEIEYVAKRPSSEESDWPAFRHELEKQRLFANDPIIRPLIDFVPNSEPAGAMMILQPFQETLWEARNTRPFTAREIKWVMKGVLLAIYTVHVKGLVYTDLKMENFGLWGFDPDKPNENVRELIVRLADCGSTNHPAEKSPPYRIGVRRSTLANPGVRVQMFGLGG
ncbi:hypothetical protein VTN77DRAFT_8070 [Rasamsonia byssochlamydoides]|uniref:uncharacterized protein n=1 Tax=Rasamsonia byssochlamydoides TaxID=89139 RepID=UPI0037446149